MKWSESEHAHKSDCKIAHLEKTLSDGSTVIVERELAPEVCDKSRRFNDTVKSRMVVDANREELSLQRRLAQEKARAAGNIEPAIRTKSAPPAVLAGPEQIDFGPDLAAQGINDAELDNRVRDAVREALAAAEAELAALRARVAELEQAPLLPAPDALMSDWGEVGETYDDITGDLLLDAFELDEAETAAVVQTLSALRLKHLSEQLNVERARLDREHQATGVANPRSASIDRLLGLLTRRGEV